MAQKKQFTALEAYQIRMARLHASEALQSIKKKKLSKAHLVDMKSLEDAVLYLGALTLREYA